VVFSLILGYGNPALPFLQIGANQIGRPVFITPITSLLESLLGG
jgi:hypothetical protein